MKIKVRNILLLIVFSLFFYINHVNADVIMEYTGMDTTFAKYNIRFNNGQSASAYNYVEIDIKLNAEINNYDYDTTSSSWNGSYKIVQTNYNALKIYFYRSGINNDVDIMLGNLAVPIIPKTNMSTFQGNVTYTIDSKKCEYDKNINEHFGNNGDIVSELNYINQCISPDATLSSLKVENGVFSSEFKPYGYNYIVYIPESLDKTVISAETDVENASINGLGEFNVTGEVTDFVIEVTASNGHKGIYYLSVVKNDEKAGVTDLDKIPDNSTSNGSESGSNNSTSGENNETNSSDSTNSSSNNESKSDSSSKNGDIENPDTGIGFQYGLILVLIISGILIGYYVKKHNKIHKI